MEKITFEDIKRANEIIKTTKIKGKEYAEVNQRIKAFRMLYPTGIIETELVSNENNICVFRARVGYQAEDNLFHTLATGTAYEKEDSTFINKTSYIENCETSAVGRALGMAGFGIDTSVASAEDIANQEKKQTKTIKSTKKEEIMIQDTQKELIKQKFTTNQIKEYLTSVNKAKLSDLTLVEASDFLKKSEEK